jgi:hypothetical protein
MLQGKSSYYYYTSLGVSQYFLKRKLMLSVAATDPFWNSKKYTYNFKDITYTSHSETMILSRTIRLNLTYNFGKMDFQVKKASRSIQNEDLKNSSNRKEE